MPVIVSVSARAYRVATDAPEADMLFDGAPELASGCLRPDTARPGLGLSLSAEVPRYAVAD